MKTSCFKYYTGDMGVAICLYPPIDWTGLNFIPLEPTPEIFFQKKSGKIDEKEYEKRYREEVLSKLDPKQVYNMFRDNVLLCWEEPVFDKNRNIINEGKGFCHRHIIGKWIWENLRIETQEWRSEKDNKPLKNKPLF